MVSFDVFDTLLTRSTAIPKGIFLIIQYMLSNRKYNYSIDESFAQNFYYHRVGAEQVARTCFCKNGLEDITLDQIYKVLVSCGNIDKEQAQKIKELELKVEYDNILPISENILKIKDFLAAGEKVILISDMYLSAKEIRVLLCKVDSVFTELPIYVSSDYGKTKSSGNLYREIAKKENVSFKKWNHYGDNAYSDVKIPQMLGIHATKINIKKPMPYEKKLLDEFGHDAFVQSVTGVSEYLNMQCLGGMREILGNSYGGPIIYSYVLWILETSLKKEICRLYFIARDGWILKQVADIIIKNRNLPINTYYIYGSRKAWRMASLYDENCDFEQILMQSDRRSWKTGEDIAEFLQIPWEELRALLPNQYQQIENPKTFSHCCEFIIQYLSHEPAFKKLILEKCAETRQIVQHYLCANIDLSDDHFAFVELSGIGYTQVCLANIIGQIRKCSIRSFFMQLRGVWDKSNCSFYVFFPNYIRNAQVVELLCRAPHGQTEGYERKDGQIVPVLEESEGELIKRYGYTDYIKGVLSFATQYEQINVQNRILSNTKLISSYLEYMAETTGTEVQSFLEDMPFSAFGVQRGQTFAPPVKNNQLRVRFWWNEVPDDYTGTCLDFALEHLPEKQIRMKNFYCWIHNTGFGKWCARKRFSYLHGLYEKQRYFYPKDFFKGKVILYAAGNVGQDFYKQINKDKNLELVAWADSNYYGMNQGEKELLIPPDKIKDFNFDFILIAVASFDIFCEIKKKLLVLGIDKDQIFWICPLVNEGFA